MQCIRKMKIEHQSEESVARNVCCWNGLFDELRASLDKLKNLNLRFKLKFKFQFKSCK
jgi:hypothetical protein